MAKSNRKTSKPVKPSTPQHRPSGRPMWSGSISFGLINIPIKLYPGIRAKDVRFHLLHSTDQSRLQEKLICPVDHKEVSRQEAVKGYEIGHGQHVIVSQEEIDSLAPKASRTIELVNIVELSQIDPMYFNRPFYILPDEGAGKAYALLVESLRTVKKAAIAKLVMRNREYIGAIRPIKQVLCLDTLHFADELVSVESLGWKSTVSNVKEAEIKMAMQLLDSLSGDFEPEKLHDDYRQAVLDLVQRKAEGKEIVSQPEPEEKGTLVIDLMEALKKSVADVQRRKGHKAA